MRTLVPFLLIVSACGGSTDSAEDPRALGSAATSSPRGPESPALAALHARCDDPTRGAADQIVSKADMPTRIAGSWFFCPNYGKSKQKPLADQYGIEISADGRWWWLTLDAAGELVRKPGVENAGRWDQDWGSEDQVSLVYFRLWNDSFFWLSLGFETEPRRMLGTYYDPDPVHAIPIAAK